MSTSEIFLIAMAIIFVVPYLLWRVGKTDYYAPLVVVQIITGILLGPGILGALYPHYYGFVFNAAVVQALNGVAWWAVMVFVWIAGIELDYRGSGRIAVRVVLPQVSRWVLPCCWAARWLWGFYGIAAGWGQVRRLGNLCLASEWPVR